MLGLSPWLTAYIIAITVIIGLVMGSFANCMASRIATGESFIKGRSHCPGCGHTLAPRELIPVFSWLFQKGRCRSCGMKISLRYPLSELIMALLFTGVVLFYDITPKTFMFLILTVILAVAALVDYDEGIIPNGTVIAAIINFVVFTLISGGDILHNLLWGLIGGVSISLPLLIFVLIFDKIIKKESMGGGDIKLFFAIGLYFSCQVNLLMLIISCFIGIGFYFIYNVGKASSKSKPFPFGPAICTACYICSLVGTSFVNFYLSLFN